MQAEAGGRRAPPPFLVIVRREAQELYGALQVQFADEVHVRVIWDRRVGERRVHGAPMAVDRRGGDRRGPPPVSWGLGVVFVPQWMGKPERDRPLRPGGP